MWILHKSFYVSAGFDSRLFYKAASFFLDPITKQKMCLTAERAPQELRDFFHPSQLEKRFGGDAETPTQFWPPFVGDKFVPGDDNSYMDIMDEETYLKALDDNPQLLRRPDLITDASQNTRDFRFDEGDEKAENDEIEEIVEDA